MRERDYFFGGLLPRPGPEGFGVVLGPFGGRGAGGFGPPPPPPGRPPEPLPPLPPCPLITISCEVTSPIPWTRPTVLSRLG
jgi:hypothetical protein